MRLYIVRDMNHIYKPRINHFHIIFIEVIVRLAHYSFTLIACNFIELLIDNVRGNVMSS